MANTNPGTSIVTSTVNVNILGHKLTLAEVQFPTAEILADTARVYQTPTGQLMQSNGTGLYPIGGVVGISGTPGVGNLLTASIANGYAVTGYQWNRNGGAISGATASTYTLVSADIGTSTTVSVTGVSFASAGVFLPLIQSLPLGAVATAVRLPNASSGGGKYASSRSRHYLRTAVNGNMQLAFPNWYVSDTYIETGAGGVLTLRASVEYNGTFVQCTWGGSSTVTVPDASTSPLSDPVAGMTIPVGAPFFVRMYVVYSGSGASVVTGIPGSPSSARPDSDTANGEFGTVSGTVISDQTGAVGAMTGSDLQYLYAPVRIVAPTNAASVYILGDSKVWGAKDVYTGTSGDKGNCSRSIGPNWAYFRCGKYGENSLNFLASNALRLALKTDYSHLVIAYGTNDFFSSFSNQTIFAALQSIKALFGNMPTSVMTVTPSVVSSDNMATQGGQTPYSWSAQRVALNASLRNAGFANVFDPATLITDQTDLLFDKWKTNGTVNYLSDDGVHELNTANLLYQSLGLIPANAFTR